MRLGFDYIFIGLLVLIINFVISHFVAKRAPLKNRSYNDFFIIAFFGGWLTGFIILAALPQPESKPQGLTGLCPYCDELISVNASICKHCHQEVLPISGNQ